MSKDSDINDLIEEVDQLRAEKAELLAVLREACTAIDQLLNGDSVCADSYAVSVRARALIAKHREKT